MKVTLDVSLIISASITSKKDVIVNSGDVEKTTLLSIHHIDRRSMSVVEVYINPSLIIEEG